MLLGDLDVESSDLVLNDFCKVCNYISLVNEPAFFKIPDNPSCINLFLTNRSRSFQNTVAKVTDSQSMLDFHKIVNTVLKVFYKKQKPKIIQYSYKNFDNQLFQRELIVNC